LCRKGKERTSWWRRCRIYWSSEWELAYGWKMKKRLSRREGARIKGGVPYGGDISIFRLRQKQDFKASLRICGVVIEF
jgi:hypothetical protein